MTLTISGLELLVCAVDRVLLIPSDIVLASEDGGFGHDIELVANGKRVAELETGFGEDVEDAGCCGRRMRANSNIHSGKCTHRC